MKSIISIISIVVLMLVVYVILSQSAAFQTDPAATDTEGIMSPIDKANEARVELEAQGSFGGGMYGE